MITDREDELRRLLKDATDRCWVAVLAAEMDRTRADNSELEGALSMSREAVQSAVDDFNAANAELDAAKAEIKHLRKLLFLAICGACQQLIADGDDCTCTAIWHRQAYAAARAPKPEEPG